MLKLQKRVFWGGIDHVIIRRKKPGLPPYARTKGIFVSSAFALVWGILWVLFDLQHIISPRHSTYFKTSH